MRKAPLSGGHWTPHCSGEEVNIWYWADSVFTSKSTDSWCLKADHVCCSPGLKGKLKLDFYLCWKSRLYHWLSWSILSPDKSGGWRGRNIIDNQVYICISDRICLNPKQEWTAGDCQYPGASVLLRRLIGERQIICPGARALEEPLPSRWGQ